MRADREHYLNNIIPNYIEKLSLGVNMKRIKIDAFEVRQEEGENGELYFGQCVECDKMLNIEEWAYGHDCE